MTVKITITGDGLHYESETTIVRASQVVAFLGSDQVVQDVNATSTSQRPQMLNTSLERPKTSPREALIEANAKTNPQKIATLGKYIMDRDRVEAFTSIDVREQLKKSGESIPKNLTRDMKEAVRANYISEDDTAPDKFYVTEYGMEAVRAQFKNTSGKPLKSKRHTAKPGTPSMISEHVKNLEISTEIDGLPNYWVLEDNKGYRILWILFFAEQKGVSQLTFKEIEYIATNLKDDIQAKAVTALLKLPAKNGYVSPVVGGYRILKQGIELIKNYENTKKEV